MKLKEMWMKNCQAFSMVELLVVVAILAVMIGGGFFALSTGQNTWFTTDTNIELQENLRQAFEKMSRELIETGSDENGNLQFAIDDNLGVFSSDRITFSIPVICHAGDSVMTAATNVAYWGAPLTWGCTSSTCMDADNDCGTVDYKSIHYMIDNDNRLYRKVLNSIGQVVRTDTIAQNIVNFQISASADNNVITLSLTAQKKSAVGRLMTASTSVQVFLRNRG